MPVTEKPGHAARSPERGQVLPLLLVVLALAAASALFVAEVAIAALERSQAQAAADAAALAGAAAGPADAAAVARANGGEVLAYRDLGAAVEVEVGYRRAQALATAAASGVDGADRDGLAPVLLAALARADQLLGRSVPLTSGYRSRTEQEELWARRGENPYPVALPGTSRHEAGLAIDVPASFVPTLLPVAPEAGLCQPLPQTDPVHFEPCPLTRAA